MRADAEREANALHDRISQEVLDVNRMVKESRVVACAPEEAVDVLGRGQELMGCNQIDRTFYFGGIAFVHAQRSHRLFAERVIPKLRRLAA